MFNRIASREELENLLSLSASEPIIIFKHSNSCPISLDVRASLESCDETLNEIVVQSDRDLSNIVADKTGIRHESPQALVIHKGKVLYSASHFDITAEGISAAIKSSGA